MIFLEYMSEHLVFGPVPSRRLGRSLGINNIPPKICTYSCIYCQLGRTLKLRVKPASFYTPETIFRAVRQQLDLLQSRNQTVDYLTFVPDGEPTLDIHLREHIAQLRELGIPIAVITNASLLFLPGVREALLQADLVSLKVDAADEKTWRAINRPHHQLQFSEHIRGMVEFSQEYRGKILTETMLIPEINTTEPQLESLAELITRLQPEKAYLAIPIRPPAEKFVHPPDENTLNRAFQIFSQKLATVEYLIGYEGNAFASTGRVRDDLLSITAVHPMRHEAITEFLHKNGASFELVKQLIREGEIIATEYQGHTFYLRKIKQ